MGFSLAGTGKLVGVDWKMAEAKYMAIQEENWLTAAKYETFERVHLPVDRLMFADFLRPVVLTLSCFANKTGQSFQKPKGSRDKPQNTCILHTLNFTHIVVLPFYNQAPFCVGFCLKIPIKHICVLGYKVTKS